MISWIVIFYKPDDEDLFSEHVVLINKQTKQWHQKMVRLILANIILISICSCKQERLGDIIMKLLYVC